MLPPNALPQPPSPPAPADDATTSSRERLMLEYATVYLEETRRERRWRRWLRLGWLLLAVWLVWMAWSQSHVLATPKGPHTALIDVRGELAADTPASAEMLVEAIRAALNDHGAQALVLRINSPGGSPVQAGIVHDEILRLKQLAGKKVYVVVDEICASGAYYIAAAADEVYVNKASVVGSIGVLMDGFGFVGLMQKLGIERRLFTAGEDKGMLDPYLPVTPAQRAHTQEMLDQIHRQFIEVVRQGRGEKLRNDPTLFSGRFWNGEEAVRLGLADGYGTADQVAREIVQAEELVDYTPRENVAERLVKRFGASAGAGAVRAMRETPALR